MTTTAGSRAPILGSIALAGLIAVLIADCAGGTGASHSVAVVDRSYAPASVWYANGIAADGKPVFTTHYEGEHWRVVVRDGDQVRAVDVGQAVWACATPGSSLTTSARIGRWTGLPWNRSLSVPPRAEAAP